MLQVTWWKAWGLTGLLQLLCRVISPKSGVQTYPFLFFFFPEEMFPCFETVIMHI